ncbi:MAG: hypothetical protein ACTSQI_00940 [Candidatus Helarchaeota archaeon]
MDFVAFIDRLSKKSRFDRNLLKRIYDKELRTQASYLKYEQKFQNEWDKWLAEGRNAENVSEFFVKNGTQLFQEWLRTMFPFNRDGRQLFLTLKEGGTPEDIIIQFFYRFSKRELEAVNKTFSYYKIREVSQRAAVIRVFSESILAIQPIISKIIGNQYSLMVDESKFLKKEKDRILFLELVARPRE